MFRILFFILIGCIGLPVRAQTADPVTVQAWSFEISPGQRVVTGTFRQIGRQFIYEYAPGEEIRYTLPVKPRRVRRIDDVVVFALGKHGVWTGRLVAPTGVSGNDEPGFRIEQRHRFTEPIADFTISHYRVTPLTGNDKRPVLLLDQPQKLLINMVPTLLDVEYGNDRIVNPKWVVETNFGLGMQMHPGDEDIFYYALPLSVRVGWSPRWGHTVGLSAFAENGEEKLFRKPNDLDEHWWGVDYYTNPLFIFYRYSLQSFPVSFQLEPLKAAYRSTGDDEYGVRLTAQWARRLQGLRVGFEVHLDKTETITRLGLWLVVGWNGPPRRRP
ncbi:hypothetical protein KKD52_00570 [Myxococcota bacterium]|nr:hypothetical protein [Myxococcota bacterium]MBU1412177.1 hypothetical protein [Myxococcota bacterium]MBU1508824.1 hypothetical protein [Myxococcota bacterium]